MVVCRFFLENRCRFGDRCYNEHILPGHSRPRYDSPERASRYSSWNAPRHQSPNAYSSNYGNVSFYENNPYQWHSSRYDSHFSGKRHNAPQYEAHSPQRYPPKPRFDGNKTISREPDHRTDENAILNCIRDDMDFWEKGGLWPFSCYCPAEGIGCVSGFDDTSPEELRYEAYKSLKENSFVDYERHVAETLDMIKRKRECLRNEPQLALSPSASQPKEETSAMQVFFGKPNPDQTAKVLFGKVVGNPTTASTFSFNHLLLNKQQAPELESMNEDPTVEVDKPSNGTFRFVLPSEQEKNTSAFISSPSVEQKSSSHRSSSELTQEELDAFMAPTFTLGKIPIGPPPKAMCL